LPYEGVADLAAKYGMSVEKNKDEGAIKSPEVAEKEKDAGK
jgi:hypothetical protein